MEAINIHESLYSRSLIDSCLDPLVTIDSKGKIKDLNPAFSTITGSKRSELIGTDFLNCFTDPQTAEQVYKDVFIKGFVNDFPLTIRHKDGKLNDVLFNGS